ncbi:MAG: endo-1,4-beta-xylanase [Pirellulales bacterium]|nr:endo-1,4-beta-xylanase [Pirellulales bacterium]
MRFFVDADSAHAPPAWEKTQFINIEGLPYLRRVRWEPPYLILDRGETDSGHLLCAWQTAQHGQIALTTGTLIERAAPYHLGTELARGTLNRVRNQTAMWQIAGMSMPDDLQPLTKAAIQWLARAVTSEEDPQQLKTFAQLSLDLSLQAIHSLTQSYARQTAVARARQTPKQIVLIGAQVPLATPPTGWPASLETACNTIGLSVSWKEIEIAEGEYSWTALDRSLAWSQSQNLRVCLGPILDWGAGAFPDWLTLWEDDFDNLLTVTTDFVRRVVTRYKGRVQLWNAASKINTTPVWVLSDEQRLRLAVKILETIREVDPRTPLILTIDQPTGECLAESAGELTPWHFVDALCRAELGLAGLGLEYRLGFATGESLPRDPLAICQQLDLWSMLNLPLLLFLQYAPQLPHPEQAQSRWLQDVGPVILGKQAVQGLFWNTLVDGPQTAPAASSKSVDTTGPAPGDTTKLDFSGQIRGSQPPVGDTPAATASGPPILPLGLYDQNLRAKAILSVLRELRLKYGN